MPVSERIARERQQRHEARMARAEEVVPEGMYCYRHTGRMVEQTSPNGTVYRVPETVACPYHKIHGGKRSQENGYCRLLKAGDWMPRPHGTMLLWDSVKECGINMGELDEPDPID